MSHTPGPWRVVPFVDATVVSAEADNKPVCKMHGREEHMQNARLIAAAPDLLAACEQLLVKHWDTPKTVQDMVLAAIAKAKGKNT